MARQTTVRAVDLLRNRSWFALAPAAALAFGLAFWGFTRFDAKLTSFEYLEKSAQLVKGQGAYTFPKDPWQLVLAQWLMPLVALATAAKLFLRGLRRDLRVVFAKRSHDHVIVCGVGSTGRRVIEILRAQGERVLAIDLNAESVDAYAAESLGTPTIPGDAKSSAVLRLAGIRRAKMLVACTGDDTINLEIALLGVEAGASSFHLGKHLVVVPEMRADWLFEHLLSRSGNSLGSESAEIRILNTAEKAGRLLCRTPAFLAQTILRPERTDIVIVGFGDVGRAVAAQVLRTGSALPDRRMRLHVFDARSDVAVSAFTALYPGVAEVADLVATDANISPANPDKWKPICDCLETTRLAAFIICLPHDGEALYTATRARASLDAIGERATPVFVRVAGRRKLAEVIARTDTQTWLGDRFVSFGDAADLLGDALGANEGDILARACHEAYLDTLKQPSEAPSSRPWSSLPELFKRSNRLFADHLEIKLRTAGLRSCPADTPRGFVLTKADLDILSAAEHWRWLVERKLGGWSYGPVRDDATLRHPLLRPWSELPDDVQTGVRSIVERIPVILARVGREIRRERVIRGDEAQPTLESFDPDMMEHVVLELEPDARDTKSLALQALDTPHVSLRFAPRNARDDLSFGDLSPDRIQRLYDRIDGSLDFDVVEQTVVDRSRSSREPT